MTEYTSDAGYALIDTGGRTIGVAPNGTSPDSPEQTVSRFEPHQRGTERVELFGINLPKPIGAGDSTLGFEYKEWVIRPGTHLYVLGEVHDKIGPLVIAKPEQQGHFIISTRSEAELRAARTTRHKFVATGVVGATVLGLGLTVGGVVS